jgi:hypothetical protein
MREETGHDPAVGVGIFFSSSVSIRAEPRSQISALEPAFPSVSRMWVKVEAPSILSVLFLLP